jgi:hypothetical protein
MPLPYNIQCTTCQRVLTVRTAAAVGKILPCPKCGSMVLVEPPPGGLTNGAADIGAQALAADDPQQKDTVPDNFAEPADMPAATPTAVAAAPNADWMSSETRQLKRWLLIGATALAAVILVIIGLGAWITGRQGHRPDVAKAESPSVDDAQQQAATDSASDGSPPGPGDVDPEQATDTVTPAAPGTAVPGDVVVPIPDRPAIAEVPENDAPRPAHAPVAGEPDPATGDERPAPSRRLTVDEALREFDGLLEDTTFDRALTRAASDYDLIPGPAEHPDFSAALPRPRPLNINTETLLAQRLLGVEFADVPLRNFLSFVSDFTTAPVTLDMDSLWRAGISPEAPVRVMANNEPLSGIMQRALEPLGLAYSVEEQHIVVRALGELSPVTRSYDVLDLVMMDRAEERALVQVLTALIAPRTWSDQGGGGTISVENGQLTVHQLPANHFQVLMFCERLRIARGLPAHGTVPDPWPDQEPRIRLGLSRLAQTTTANFVSPTRFVDILVYLEEAGDLQLIVDWQSLGTLGWNPQALARIEATDQPLSQVLQSLLAPMELSFRVIGSDTLQITSAKVANATLEVEFYPVGDLLAKDKGQPLLEGVRTILGDAIVTDQIPGGVRVDAKSQAIIVSAPQYQQAAIARLIEQLAGDAGPAAAAIDPEAKLP